MEIYSLVWAMGLEAYIRHTHEDLCGRSYRSLNSGPQNSPSPNFVGKKKPEFGTVFGRKKKQTFGALSEQHHRAPKLIDCRQRSRVGSKRTSSKEEKVLSQLCIEDWRWLCSRYTADGFERGTT